MQYFIPIAKRKHHLWQTELLLQSLKGLDLFDNVMVAIADRNEPVSASCPNILEARKFLIHDHQEAHVLASLIAARDEKILEPPYAILHPDMVLVKPIEVGCSAAFDLCGRGMLDDYREEIRKSMPDDRIMPTGGIICINEEPVKFIDHLTEWSKRLSAVKRDRSAVRTAFACAAWESYAGRDILVEKLSAELPEETPSMAIHYFRGLPPYFHKNMFGDEVCLSGNPFDALLQTNPTINTEIVQRQIRAYQTAPAKKPKRSVPVGVIVD